MNLRRRLLVWSFLQRMCRANLMLGRNLLEGHARVQTAGSSRRSVSVSCGVGNDDVSDAKWRHECIADEKVNIWQMRSAQRIETSSLTHSYVVEPDKLHAYVDRQACTGTHQA